MVLIDALKEKGELIKRESWINWAMNREGKEYRFDETIGAWRISSDKIDLTFEDAIAADWKTLLKP